MIVSFWSGTTSQVGLHTFTRVARLLWSGCSASVTPVSGLAPLAEERPGRIRQGCARTFLRLGSLWYGLSSPWLLFSPGVPFRSEDFLRRGLRVARVTRGWSCFLVSRFRQLASAAASYSNWLAWIRGCRRGRGHRATGHEALALRGACCCLSCVHYAMHVLFSSDEHLMKFQNLTYAVFSLEFPEGSQVTV